VPDENLVAARRRGGVQSLLRGLTLLAALQFGNLSVAVGQDTSPGSLDGLNALVAGTGANVYAMVVQPDGKTILAGQFTSVLGAPRTNVARLNADGTLDATFRPNANNLVQCVAVQGDGRILLAGSFTALQPNGAPTPTTRNRMARLNADGTLDTGFNPNANGVVNTLAVQADGRILIGGLFTTLQPNGAATATPRNRIARLQADGSLDAPFNPNANGSVQSLAVQADGRILLGGEFTALQPNGAATATVRNFIARLQGDGTLDGGFNPNANNVVRTLAVQADGKVLLGGAFAALQPNGAATATARGRIARLQPDGTLDTLFDPNCDNSVASIVVQADGKVLIAGFFTALQPNGAATSTVRNRIARLNANGTLDLGFNPNANGHVYGLALAADGKVLLGGLFGALQPNGAATATTRARFARLHNEAATQSLSIPGASQVLWTRGGASPEVSQVTVELSLDGGSTWTPLGNATRVGATANWQLTGLSLPASGQIRVRGRTTGGYNNGSAGLVETVASFNLVDIAVEQPAGTSLTDGTGSVAFGTVTLGGSPVVRTFTIRNTGGASLSGLAVTKDGTHAADFTVGALGSTTVAPGGTTTFTVSFAPGAVGARTAAIHIASNVTGTKNPFDLNLTGTGLGVPDITVEQPAGTLLADGTGSVAFGTVTLGSSALVKTVTIRNPGTAPLSGLSVTKDGTHAADFTVGALGSTTVSPGGTTTFTVSFAPGAVGARTAAIHIANNLFGAKSPFDLNLTGTGLLDTSPGSVDGLNVPVGGAPAIVYATAVQLDGRILLAGEFTSVLGVPRTNVARLNADGTLDTTFNPNANNRVNSVAVQADGKILLGGWFTTLQPNGAATATTRSRIARLNADGTLDTAFNPTANGDIYNVAVQADGKILIGGAFSVLQPNGAAAGTTRNYVARLHADGALDTTFNPNANPLVYSLTVQSEGKILIGGVFTRLQPNGAATPTPRSGFARLNNDAATQSLTASSTSQVVWNRGGSAPEVSQVTFELSVNGGATWAALGNATRVGTTSNWQLTGLSLPTSGQVRARGRTSGGYNNGTSGLVESVANFSLPPGIAVEQPAGAPLADGTGSVAFGTVTLGSSALVKTFTIRNTGTGTLSLGAITKDGAHAADFTVGALGSTTVAPGGTTTFTVSFGPGAGGARTAAIHIASNVAGALNPFDLNMSGTGVLDTSPGSVDGLNAPVAGSSFSAVYAAAVQPDGKIVIGGRFISVLGVARNRIARLNADGTLDTVFNPNANDDVRSLAVQADGKILIGGSFRTLQPNGAATATTRNHIARLNADGTLDTAFNPNASSTVFGLVVQTDSKILVGGHFITLQPNGAATATTRRHIARLNADGTLDTAFNPNANDWVYGVSVQADGKVLLGGHFTALQPNGAATATSRNRIARLNVDGTLDTAFNPNANDRVYDMAIQADGKVLIGGYFTTLRPNGAASATTRNRIARLNTDGTLDTAFNPGADHVVYSLAVQADGKILIGGGFATLQANGAATPTARIGFARLNADGTLDTAFNPNANNLGYGVSVQADGKVLIGGTFTTLQPNGAATPTARMGFARLNNDTATQSFTVPSAAQVLWNRGGSAPEVSRVTFELSVNGGATWTPLGNGTRVGTTAHWQLTGLSLPNSGQIRARGRTTAGVFNGSSGLVEFVASFSLPPGIAVEQPAGTSLADGTGSVAFGTMLVNFPATTRTFTIRNTGIGSLSLGAITKDGAHAADFTVGALGSTTVAPGGTTTFTVGFSPGAAGARSAAIHIASNVAGALNPFDLNLTGTGVLDTSPGSVDGLNSLVAGGAVYALAVQPDGKAVLAGTFTSVLGVARNNIARLNADGTLDAVFNPNANSQVSSVAVQSDGKVLIGGQFTTLQPNGAASATTRNRIARLNADGTLDTAFNPNANSTINEVLVQADGKILIAGNFTTLQPNGAATATARNYLARLNADGTLATAFNPKPNLYAWALAVQADGKILVGGAFTALQPNGAPSATTRSRIAGLNADGSLDTAFNPNANSSVEGISLQADGRILILGQFTALQPNGAASATTRNRIARLNSDGSLDAGFNPNANNRVFSLAVQADGKILAGGAFTTLQPNGAASATTRNRVARLNTDGTLETTFNPNANSTVYGVAVQADGKVLLGGSFTALQPNGAATATARNGFARLNNDAATQSLSTPSASQVVWQRGGAAPEVSRVTFELSVNGGATWTLLGHGARVAATANWQLTGLSLPGTGQIRARGRTSGGYGSGSEGVVHTEAILVPPDIAVEQPAGTSLADGTGSVPFGTVTAGSTGLVKTVIIRNTGAGSLTLGAITKDGAHATDFTVGAPASTTMGPGGSTIFTVSFAPGAAGARTAAIHIASNVPGSKNPYDLTLTGTGLLDTTPGSVDALNAGIAGLGAMIMGSAVQPDGRILLAGDFASVLGVARSHVARLNADGTLDTGFNPKPNYRVSCVAVQPDGKILLGGGFTTLQPNGAASATARVCLARLNADGSLDTGFNPRANSSVYCLAVQADGKILIGGSFTTLQPNGAATATGRAYVARLHADGTLDTAFDPRANDVIQGLAVQADGKILLAGTFTSLQPNGAASATIRNRIARLNADGTLDTAFNPNANNPVHSVAPQADGRILLGGQFTALQPNGAATGTARHYVARLNTDGTLDTVFDPKANNFVFSLTSQADGKILLGGTFTTLQPNGAAVVTPRNYAARLNADGTVDTAFNPNPNNLVFSVASQADGKVLLGGQFSALQPNGAATATTRNLFARLNNTAATQTLSAPTTAQVVWNRGGTAPELSQVTFELSVNGGGTWTPLGAGTRVGTTANWQRTGLALPTSGQLRARGRTAGGFSNGSAGLVETVASFSGIAPQEWVPSAVPVRITRVTGENGGALRLEFEPLAAGGSVEVWSAATVDAATWTRLDSSWGPSATAGHLELRLPVDPDRPQQFYRLAFPSGPAGSTQRR